MSVDAFGNSPAMTHDEMVADGLILDDAEQTLTEKGRAAMQMLLCKNCDWTFPLSQGVECPRCGAASPYFAAPDTRMLTVGSESITATYFPTESAGPRESDLSECVAYLYTDETGWRFQYFGQRVRTFSSLHLLVDELEDWDDNVGLTIADESNTDEGCYVVMAGEIRSAVAEPRVAEYPTNQPYAGQGGDAYVQAVLAHERERDAVAGTCDACGEPDCDCVVVCEWCAGNGCKSCAFTGRVQEEDDETTAFNERTLILHRTTTAANARGVYLDVNVYEYPNWPRRFDVYVGGWRVASLKTRAGALKRADHEVNR